MATTTFTYHRLARWALDHLSRRERKKIRDAINSVLTLPPEQWPSDRVRLLIPERSLYVLYATPYWRVFFTRLPSGEIVIEDVMNKEAIRVLGGGGNNVEAGG
jgi:hypothetical protein